MDILLDKFLPLLLAALIATCLGYYFSTRIQKADVVNKKKDYFLKLLEQECLKLYNFLNDEKKSLGSIDEQLILVSKFISLAFIGQGQVTLELYNNMRPLHKNHLVKMR